MDESAMVKWRLFQYRNNCVILLTQHANAKLVKKPECC